MQRSRRGLVAVAALLLCELAAVIWATRDAGVTAQGEAAREEAATSDAARQTADAQQVEPALAQAPREQVDATTSPDGMPADELRFIGRVLDPAREPIAGAQVTLQRRETEGYMSLDITENAKVDRIAATASDADGWFSFELPRGVPQEIEVRARGHADQREMLCYAGQRREIVLVAAAEHALGYGEKPPALFSHLVRRGLWKFITQDDEDAANRRIKRELCGHVRQP